MELDPAQSNAVPDNAGIQKRIDELTAQRHAEAAKAEALQQQLMQQAAITAEQAARLQQIEAERSRQVTVNPLDAYKETVDGNVLSAVQAALAEQNKQFQMQLDQMNRTQSAQLAALNVQRQVSVIPGIPVEVSARAEGLIREWRKNGWNFPEQDAIDIALGQITREKMQKGQAHIHNPAAQLSPTISGGAPAPYSAPTRPANFDLLSPSEQNAILERTPGFLDEPF